MKIEDAFDNVKRLGIETAPFIYFTESRAGYVEKMRAIFALLIQQDSEIVASTIVLPECLMKPLREKDFQVVKAYTALFEQTSGINLWSVDSAVARRAADLRATYNLRTPDALHVATALQSNCDAFLTNDFGLKRVQEIRVLLLDELEIIDSSEE